MPPVAPATAVLLPPDPECVRRLFSGPVGVGVSRTGDEARVPLHPREADLLPAAAGPARRVAFALGRIAARRALADAALAAVRVPEDNPVLMEAGGQPRWPPGVCGSISHTGPLAVAVVGDATRYRGLGVDIEAASRDLSDAAARHVCSPAELAWATQEAGQRTERLLRLFSAKEAIFKALYPLEGVFLGFHDAALRWVPDASGFEATLRRAVARDLPPGTPLVVCSARAGAYVLAGVQLAW